MNISVWILVIASHVQSGGVATIAPQTFPSKTECEKVSSVTRLALDEVGPLEKSLKCVQATIVKP
jgi:hypothetical protein